MENDDNVYIHESILDKLDNANRNKLAGMLLFGEAAGLSRDGCEWIWYKH